ncbi:TetR/AcrR family transcriptional regulator [Phytomonospora sp. NPDC050363]|uniref:TetR/AcrR family transcriptional regulator n=1 Tax=Phytomonospora sp. NPDC050363 TaxID=3155642 RepID=UPI0033EF3F28
MPKQVDHAERRRHLARAVCRIIATRGLDAVSLRDVAAEAGVSMGAVQHYFKTKEDMLVFALEDVNERGAARVGEYLAAIPDAGPRDTLRGVLLQMLPVDEESREAVAVGLAFWAKAATSPRLAEHLREGYGALRDLIALLLGQSKPAPGVDAADEADALFALAEGLSSHILVGHREPATAVRIIDAQLARLLP